MEVEQRDHSAQWRWPLLLSVVCLNVCLPNLVLSYGVYLVNFLEMGESLWPAFATPTLFVLIYGLTQCWCREAADTWGSSIGYRILAVFGFAIIIVALLICAFIPPALIPYVYGLLGGYGTSLLSAQVDAVIFENYYSHLAFIRGLCFAGQAVGQSLFPHIITELISLYGYSYSFILFAAIMLQMLPFVLFIKVDDDLRLSARYSRYADLTQLNHYFNGPKFNNSVELQLQDLNKKNWKSPSEHSLGDDDDELFDDDLEDSDDYNPTITPPPSPEEKRRNRFGVEILPDIMEENEESDDAENDISSMDTKQKRFSRAIKRLSILSDSFDEFIAKQTKQENEVNHNQMNTEIEVTGKSISVPELQYATSLNVSCKNALERLKRKLKIPSHRTHRLRRKSLFILYGINDTFVKPLVWSLSCWRFYPALLLSFSKLSLTTIFLVLMPLVAREMQPKISLTETNFLMSLHGFTWICFLLSTPWIINTPKRNLKYLTVCGLAISTMACFVLATANNHDGYSIGCVVAGFGYGAITSSWEPTSQDFLGPRRWPKVHSTLETTSAVLLTFFVIILYFLVKEDPQYYIFILGALLAIITLVWLLIATISFAMIKIRERKAVRRDILTVNEM